MVIYIENVARNLVLYVVRLAGGVATPLGGWGGHSAWRAKHRGIPVRVGDCDVHQEPFGIEVVVVLEHVPSPLRYVHPEGPPNCSSSRTRPLIPATPTYGSSL